MLTSRDFRPCDANESDLDIPLFKSTMPSSALAEIGPSVLAYDEINVFWLPTSRFPEPDDDWLKTHFPTAAQICSGIRMAFDEYHDGWCGRSMVPEIQQKLTGDQLERFQNDRWISFLAVDSIFINPTENVIWLQTDFDYDIDSNLEEHGVSIMRIDGHWKFGYGGDGGEYFAPE